MQQSKDIYVGWCDNSIQIKDIEAYVKVSLIYRYWSAPVSREESEIKSCKLTVYSQQCCRGLETTPGLSTCNTSTITKISLLNMHVLILLRKYNETIHNIITHVNLCIIYSYESMIISEHML